MSSLINSRLLLAVGVGLLLGMTIDNMIGSRINPADAQTRPSLASLQSQIDDIVAGRTAVGRSLSSDYASQAEFAWIAQDAWNWRGTVAWSDIVNVPAELNDGDDIGNAGNGVNLSGDTFSVDFGTLDARYVKQ